MATFSSLYSGYLSPYVAAEVGCLAVRRREALDLLDDMLTGLVLGGWMWTCVECGCSCLTWTARCWAWT
ncbi:MAG: hypothetical protein AB1446_13010 [Bacillota bacterium]